MKKKMIPRILFDITCDDMYFDHHRNVEVRELLRVGNIPYVEFQSVLSLPDGTVQNGTVYAVEYTVLNQLMVGTICSLVTGELPVLMHVDSNGYVTLEDTATGNCIGAGFMRASRDHPSGKRFVMLSKSEGVYYYFEDDDNG